MSDNLGSEVQIRRKVLRRFYEPLILLNSLGQIRGERLRSESSPVSPSSSQQKARRGCADSIAYICARDRGFKFVTAAALERSPQGVVVWLAANVDVKAKVISFLQTILDHLATIAQRDGAIERQQQATQIREELLSTIISFNEPRLSSYHHIVKGFVKECLPLLRTALFSMRSIHVQQEGLYKLVQWLQRYFSLDFPASPTADDLQNIVRECHEKRSSLLELLVPFAAQGQTRCHEFEQLHKLLLKLGKHATVARRLIESAVVLHQDFNQGFTIRTVSSSEPKDIPLLAREATVESTAGRAFADEAGKKRFLDRLASLWSNEELTRLSQKELLKKTYIHAEVLLINHFDMHPCTFLGGSDKYIGCSKSACYLCNVYISKHPGRFAIGSTHQKIYPAWRVPDVYSREPVSYERSKIQERILLGMITKVRQDLATDMESQEPRRPFHADSTVGITTTLNSAIGEIISQIKTLQMNDATEVGRYVKQEPVSEEYELCFENEEEDGGVPLP